MVCDEVIAWEAMQANGTIVVEAKLIDACSEACPEHHARPGSDPWRRGELQRLSTRGELLYTEMACSLSHLRAMRLASSQGQLCQLGMAQICLDSILEDMERFHKV